ncbi:type VII secretion integral membrane protein EccD [Kineosporia sp. J2-2]|uniref:Type VII secretion integral membrane protein EccD n=1 Tax=Kineosporia corallincola TaxID=2835133 RepID=A0ABS5TTX2_9ACTN|nr:type VII secretion integral membrane protein EccD [Kineosporia corallincola]MBT0774253.1 type VII secretion integral membrane protein EccD [Kineosporia corallincola]
MAEVPAVGGGALAGLCRLTIRGPGRSFDLAIPTDIQLADLMSTIVGYAGDDLDEAGLGHGGWVLQRLGAEPLSPTATAGELELHDGEVLYLRPFRDALPAVHFDDLVHGVMDTLTARGDTWRPELSRRLLIGVLSAALILGAGGLLLAAPRLATAINGAVIAVVLLGAAAAAARAYGDTALARVLTCAATGYAVLAAAVLPSGAGLAENHARLLAAGIAAAAAAAVGFAATGEGAALYLGIGTAGLMTALAGALIDVTYEHTAAIIGAVAVLLMIFVPGWAFWLSGLRLPPLPSNAEQLQEGIDAHPSEIVISRSAVADRFLNGLCIAVGTVYAVTVVTLALTATGISGLILAWVLSGLAVLHGRTLGGTWQRLAVVVPGVAGIGTLIGRYILTSEGPGPLVTVNLLWMLALGLAVASRTIPGRRMVPHWARAGEVTHSVLAVSLLPLLLACLGLFTFLRGIGG